MSDEEVLHVPEATSEEGRQVVYYKRKLPMIRIPEFTSGVANFISWKRAVEVFVRNKKAITEDELEVIATSVNGDVWKFFDVHNGMWDSALENISEHLKLMEKEYVGPAALHKELNKHLGPPKHGIEEMQRVCNELDTLKKCVDPALLLDAIMAYVLLEQMSPEVQESIRAKGKMYQFEKMVTAINAVLDGMRQRKQQAVVAYVDSRKRPVAANDRSNPRVVRCYGCGKIGHMVKDCRKKNVNKRFDASSAWRSEEPLIVPMWLGGVRKRCFLDGGAMVSLIREEALDGMDILSYRKVDKKLWTADGSAMTVRGVVDVELQHKNRRLVVPLGVASRLFDGDFDVLIGRDILRVARITIDHGTDTICSVVDNRDEWEKLKDEFEDVLVEKLDCDVGKANVPEVRIEVDPNVKPSYVRNYRMAPDQKKKVEEEVEKMLAADVIELAENNGTEKGWNSPILLVRKKNGDWRFCVDFRRLNAATLKINGPLPRINDIVEGAADARIFSRLDLASGYWQIPIAKESRKYLTFESTRRQYQFKVMPFGITNAPAIFQRMIDRVLGDMDGVAAYIDDIVIFSKSLDEHKKKVREVLERMRTYNLKANIHKCLFGVEEIDIFGFRISKGKVMPSPERAKAIEQMKKPANPDELRTFLGMINYYRHLVDHMAEDEATLRQQLKKWNWNTDCDVAYEQLIKKLVSLPAIHPHFLDATRLEVHTDASGTALGGVLIQIRPNGDELPVAYMSRILSETERQYSTTERELLAVHAALKKFEPYLADRKFTLKTDHKPLIGMLKNRKCPFGARWNARFIYITSHDMDIEYIKGERNQVPDALSRLVGAVIGINWNSLEEAQKFDREVQEELANGKDIILNDGVVTKILKDGTQVVVLPQALRYHALKEAHGSPLGGHFGVKKTLAKLRTQWYWRGMKLDVNKFVGTCAECLRKNMTRQKAESSEHIEVGGIWETLAMDHFGPFVVDQTGRKKYVLVVMDMFSKYVEAKAVETTGAAEVTKFLYKLFLRNGCPKSVLTDHGKAFVSEAVEQCYEKFGVKGKRSTPYNPQGNGIVERAIGTIKSLLRATLENEYDVREKLPQVIAAYNNAKHATTTGYTPFYLFHGFEQRSALGSLLLPSQKETVEDVVRKKLTALGRSKLEAESNVAKQRLQQDIRLTKQKKIRQRGLEVGSKAFLIDPTARRTFQPRYQEIVQVIAKPNANTRVIRCGNGREEIVNVRRLIEKPEDRTPFEVYVYEEKENVPEQSSSSEENQTMKTQEAMDTRRNYVEVGITQERYSRMTRHGRGSEDVRDVRNEERIMEEERGEERFDEERKEDQGSEEDVEKKQQEGEEAIIRSGFDELKSLTKDPDPGKSTTANVALEFLKQYQKKGRQPPKVAIRDAVQATATSNREELINVITRPLEGGETAEQRAQTVAQKLKDGLGFGGGGV